MLVGELLIGLRIGLGSCWRSGTIVLGNMVG
jgi:hypothetical protein